MSLDLMAHIPADWRAAMEPHLDQGMMDKLGEFVHAEYLRGPCFPPPRDVFRALRLCPLAKARVLILGQDPYHRPGQAHGLSFSVPAGVALPPSLRNVFVELSDDVGVPPPRTGDLTPWATQGVLLLNSVLTVRSGSPASHAGHGWEQVSDAAIMALNARPERVVFLLWGAYARRKASLVTAAHHVVIESGHPSPMNPRGFLGGRPFSRCNAALTAAGLPPITWA